MRTTQKILQFSLNHKIITIVFVIITTIFSLYGLRRLEVNTDTENLFDQNSPDKKIYDRISSKFGSDNLTLIYIKDKKLFTHEKLKALDEITYQLSDLDFVEKVEGLYTTRNVRDVDGNIESNALMDFVPETEEEIEQVKKNALSNPLIVKNFISQDAQSTLVTVQIAKDSSGDDNYDDKVFKKLGEIVAPFKATFEEIFQIGSPRINAELSKSLFSDMKVLGIISIGVLLASIFLFLKSGIGAIIPLITSILSIIWTFGLMGHFGLEINILSAMLPSLMVALGSTEDTHMVSIYLYTIKNQMAEGKVDRKSAVRFMLKHVGVPIILTTITTVLGFLSNLINDVNLIKNFAYASSFAIAMNGLITILVVPVLLSIFGPTKVSDKVDSSNPKGMMGKFANICFELSTTHSKKVLITVGIILIIFVTLIFRVHVSNDPLSYFKKSHPIRKESLTLHQKLAGMQIFYVTLESEKNNAFKNPDNLYKLEKMQKMIKELNAFDSVFCLADHLSLVNREMHGGNQEYSTVPDSRGLVEQFLLLFQRSDVQGYVTHDYKMANIVVRHNISDSHILNRYLEKLNQHAKKIIGKDLKLYVTGENLLINKAAEELLISQIESLGLVIFIVFIMMSLLFTSIRGGIISLIPNMIPIILTFGTMGLFGLPINPGTATVAVIALGIAIDDTIHLLTTFGQESRKTFNVIDAIKATISSEFVAVVTTSIALAAGFLVLFFSDFTIITQFGVLAAATMIYAMVSDLIFTPIVMQKVRLVNIWDLLSISVRSSVIQGSPLFENMNRYQIKKTILLSKVEKHKKDDVIINPGDIGSEMYMVLVGKVDVSVPNNKSFSSVAQLEQGSVFGEVGFIQATKRTAQVKAAEDVELLVFTYEDVKQTMRFYPRIASKLNLNISKIIGKRLAKANEMIHDV